MKCERDNTSTLAKSYADSKKKVWTRKSYKAKNQDTIENNRLLEKNQQIKFI